MRKNYNAPLITVTEIETENLLGNTSYITVSPSKGTPKSPREDFSPINERPSLDQAFDCWE